MNLEFYAWDVALSAYTTAGAYNSIEDAEQEEIIKYIETHNWELFENIGPEDVYYLVEDLKDYTLQVLELIRKTP